MKYCQNLCSHGLSTATTWSWSKVFQNNQHVPQLRQYGVEMTFGYNISTATTTTWSWAQQINKRYTNRDLYSKVWENCTQNREGRTQAYCRISKRDKQSTANEIKCLNNNSFINMRKNTTLLLIKL